MDNLHKQRFHLRTPLTDPTDYWALVPKKWPETNKSMFMEHVGLETVLSPRVLELLHDRTSQIEIKMFHGINISVGRSGGSRKQNLRTLEDGSTEMVSSDDWLNTSSINMLMEALDNLVTVWIIVWPGEWSMVVLRRVVTKHQAFSDIQNMDLRKKVLETFLNKALAINASHAVRGKPPMFFAALDKMAEEFLNNRRNYDRQLRSDQSQSEGNLNKKAKMDRPPSKVMTHRQEVDNMRKRVGSLKTKGGKEVCVYFNSTAGCRSTTCRFFHGCCFVKDGKDICGENHKLAEHRRK